MTTPTEARLDLQHLSQRLREADAGALLVEERLVRRASRGRAAITRLTTHVPHTHCVAVDRETLAELVDAGELGVAVQELPAWVYLLATPDPADLGDLPAEIVLRRFWRRLFHARVDGELAIRTGGVSLPRAQVLGLIDKIGQTPFDEARAVLVDEDLIASTADETHEFCEFMALYLELSYFDPELVAHYFPALEGRDDVADLARELVDADALFEATRLVGASEQAGGAVVRPVDKAMDAPLPELSRRAAKAVSARAARARQRGNDAHGAVLFSLLATEDQSTAPSRAAREEALSSLAERLTLATPDAEVAPSTWRAALEPLVMRARHGLKTVEGRLLHDLQKACVDAEREAFSVDLGRWLRGLGRGSLKRPMPCQRHVNVARHLRRAQGRLWAIRIEPDAARTLSNAVSAAAHSARNTVRSVLGAKIRQGLAESSLVPLGLLERVALDKLVDELLDGTMERGFLAFGDIRDALARNHLKLADLEGVAEFFRGDPLLRVDRAFARLLDGVYRRGEIYRRGLQRLSSLGFANVVGRFVVRFMILPFGSAFVLLEGAQHIIGPLIKLSTGAMPQIFSWPVCIAIGLFIFLLIHFKAARKLVVDGIHLTGEVLKTIFVKAPRWFKGLPPVEWLASTKAFVVFRQAFLRPLVLSLPVALLSGLIAWNPSFCLYVGVPLFITLAVFLSSRRGRRLEEEVQDWAIRGWNRFRYGFIPGLIEVTIAGFKKVVEVIEVRLYEVDQFLRFRRGESRLSLALKAFFTMIWAFFAYLIRLYINLLIEPQINPIKHFPVVTVSHKIILPLTPVLTEILATPLSFLGPVISNTIAATTVVLLPGVFGFLVWEFKENWRLYQANRRKALKPVIVGHHGETTYRLLRPGFHSGTVPKLYRKLRKAELKRDAASVRKHEEALHHAADAVGHFVSRELIALLAQSPRFGVEGLQVGKVGLTPYRITIELQAVGIEAKPLRLAFDEQSRFLVAGISQRGWLDAVDHSTQAAFETALLGFYKYAGVALVREQITSILPGRPPYDIADRGLVVWPGDGFQVEALYPLRSRRQQIRPKITGPDSGIQLPAIDVGELVFGRQALPWSRWVQAWAPGQADPDPLRDLFGPLSLLNDDSLGNAHIRAATVPG